MRMPASQDLSGSELFSAPAEQQGLQDLQVPHFGCIDDDDFIGEMRAWERQRAGINSGGQGVEFVQAEDVRPTTSKHGNACLAARTVKQMKMQVRRDARNFAAPSKRGHWTALIKLSRLLRFNNKRNGFYVVVTTSTFA